MNHRCLCQESSLHQHHQQQQDQLLPRHYLVCSLPACALLGLATLLAQVWVLGLSPSTLLLLVSLSLVLLFVATSSFSTTRDRQGGENSATADRVSGIIGLAFKK